ncbi:hypothetical protein BJY00DRAFT_280573 [Aspergillus carlsbadensis]|nr:hypothetical protein BJY00DRAFT_280573 [Aspergillus carlsbadensis]
MAIDPQVLAVSNALLPDPNVDVQELDQDIVDEINLYDASDFGENSILSTDPDAFVAFFSRINVITTNTTRMDVDALNGNSREDCRFFEWVCPKCKEYSNSNRKLLRCHVAACTGVPKTVRCPTCNKPHENERALSIHIWNYHEFKEKRCSRCPDSDLVYQTYNEWGKHLKTHRDPTPDITAIQCPLCESNTRTTYNRTAIRQHLSKVHRKLAAESKEILRRNVPAAEFAALRWVGPLAEQKTTSPSTIPDVSTT